MGSAWNRGNKIVVAHDFCIDGFTALFLIDKFMGNGPIHDGLHENIISVPLSRSTAEDQLSKIYEYATGEHELIVADYLLHPNLIEKFDRGALFERITICDHHVDADRDFLAAEKQFERVKTFFEKDMCGAEVVFEKFIRARCGQDIPPSELLGWVSTLDLGRINATNYHEISSAIGYLFKMNGGTGEALSSLAALDKMTFQDVIDVGEALEPHYRRKASLTLQSPASYIWFEGCEGVPAGYVPAINFDILNPKGGRTCADLAVELSRNVKQNRDETKRSNNAAVTIAPFYLFYYPRKDGAASFMHVSIRSCGDPDAGQIAKHMGNHRVGDAKAEKGGGHPHRAAWQCKVEDFTTLCPLYTAEFVRKHPYGPENAKLRPVIYSVKPRSCTVRSYRPRIGSWPKSAFLHERL